AEHCRQRPTLPYSFPYSTIGGSRLNFRVRNGNGCDPAPMTTGILGAWGPGFHCAAHKPRLPWRPDRPRRCQRSQLNTLQTVVSTDPTTTQAFFSFSGDRPRMHRAFERIMVKPHG